MYRFHVLTLAVFCLTLSACGGGGCDAGEPSGPPRVVADWHAECGPHQPAPAPPASAPGK